MDLNDLTTMQKSCPNMLKFEWSRKIAEIENLHPKLLTNLSVFTLKIMFYRFIRKYCERTLPEYIKQVKVANFNPILQGVFSINTHGDRFSV